MICTSLYRYTASSGNMVRMQVSMGELETLGQAGRERQVSYLSCLWRGACEGRVQRCLQLLLVGLWWFCFDPS